MFRREDREIALGVSLETGRFERCGKMIAMFLLNFLWQTPCKKITHVERVLRLVSVMIVQCDWRFASDPSSGSTRVKLDQHATTVKICIHL